MKRTYKPGELLENSGQFQLRGPRGGRYDQEVTGVRGEPTPPTPKPNMSYYLVDLTKKKQGS